MEEEKRPGMKIPIEQDSHGTYILNSKDLCLLEYVPELIDAGVKSLKIEGRAKSVAYLAQVIKTYREAIDLAFVEKDVKKVKAKIKKLKKQNLDGLMNRGYTTGFLFGQDKEIQSVNTSHGEPEKQFVGEVFACEKVGKKYKVWIKPHNALKVGDKIKILRPIGNDINLIIKDIYSKNDAPVESAHGGNAEQVYFFSQLECPIYSILQLEK
jgi:putative protease